MSLELGTVHRSLCDAWLTGATRRKDEEVASNQLLSDLAFVRTALAIRATVRFFKVSA